MKEVVETNNLSALCAAVKSAPVIVTMFTGNSGHAVVGYAVKEVVETSFPKNMAEVVDMP